MDEYAQKQKDRGAIGGGDENSDMEKSVWRGRLKVVKKNTPKTEDSTLKRKEEREERSNTRL